MFQYDDLSGPFPVPHIIESAPAASASPEAVKPSEVIVLVGLQQICFSGTTAAPPELQRLPPPGPAATPTTAATPGCAAATAESSVLQHPESTTTTAKSAGKLLPATTGTVRELQPSTATKEQVSFGI